MSTLLTILIVIAAIILILIVLVQNSKGGGLASNFSASNQIMGVRKTTDFLEKATWTLIGAIAVLCVMTTAFSKGSEMSTTSSSEITNEVGAPAQSAPAQVETINFEDMAPATEATPAEETAE